MIKKVLPAHPKENEGMKNETMRILPRHDSRRQRTSSLSKLSVSSGKIRFYNKNRKNRNVKHTEMCIFAIEKLTKQNLYGL